MIIGILFFAGATILCCLSVSASTRKSSLTQQLVALLLFAVGAHLTKWVPYLALFGCVAFIAAFLRFWSENLSKTLMRIGYTSVPAALLVLFVSLFQNPSNYPIEIEDRTDWELPVVVDKTPEELLAIEWSTQDKNCNWPVAKLLLELCDIAYDGPVYARERIREIGLESESINAGAMQGYVIDAGEDSIITLRGTEKHEYDILQDLRFLKFGTDQGAMHSGFVTGYNPMHDQVVELLKRYETKRVWLTGHSLGGGLAVVCAHRLLVDGEYPIAGMMTFGQPKVVRQDLADYLGPKLTEKYVFFVNDMDPITRLIDPYEHFGHMVRWTDDSIERSKLVIKFGNISSDNSTSPNRESGYVEDMNDAELDALIEKSEDARNPQFDENGEPLMQGFIPDVGDHYLTSYKDMLEQLKSHSTKKAW